MARFPVEEGKEIRLFIHIPIIDFHKVPHYILSQIFGSFVAGLVLMGCYWPEIQALKAADIAAHGTAV
jgi:glycerol uptake facilitator-like aquaporin